MKVFIIATMSADGFIGVDAQHRSINWRSKDDGQFFSEITKAAGVMVMGSTTYNTFKIRRAPPGRRLLIYTSKPESVHGENVETTNEPPQVLVERLTHEGANALAVCGGAIVNKMFMDAGLVDELYVTVEPVLFGSGISLFSGALQSQLELRDSRSLNPNTMLLHYAVKK